MTLQDVFDETEIRYKAIVTNETFGHLYPKRKKQYQLSMLFCYSEYGDMTIISTKQGRSLQDSPILFIDMNNFIEEHCTEDNCGSVMLFIGTYTSTKEGGKFEGTVETVYKLGEKCLSK